MDTSSTALLPAAARGADAPHWSDRLRVPRPGEPRSYARELRVSAEAQAKLARDTTDMRSVFEVLGNFPVHDLLRAVTPRLRFVRSPSFRRLFVDRSMPDLSNEAASRMVRDLPEDSVGHTYGRFLQGWGLDNAFLRDLEIDDPASYFAHRTAHCHDLFHLLLGYPPFEDRAEMEIEAFLHAQTGGLNHVLFLLGFVRRLSRQDPAELRRILPHLGRARARGRRCGNVMLVRWEDVLHRPVDEVRAELGIDDRPLLPLDRPRRPGPIGLPRLAHVVIGTPDPDADRAWFEAVLGFEVTARDDRLGAVFLSDGTDHHTLALTHSWGRGPRGVIAGIRGDLRILRSLVAAERRPARTASAAGARRHARPTARLAREHLRPGVGHVGYRVDTPEELAAWYRRLRDHGVEVDWAVNHGDLISGIYFLTPSGVRFEIFCDGPRGRAKLAAAAAGADPSELVEDDFHNWVLDPEELAR